MSHINVSEVLSSLSLAKEAYEALPDLRRQIDDLQAALASKDRLLSQTQSTLEETIAGKANVEAKLKEVESDRDDYFLRHEEAQEKLDKMAQLIGVGTSKAVNQAEPVTEPVKVEPGPFNPITYPESVSQSAPLPTAQTAPTTSGVGSADTAASSSTEPTGQSAVPPTQVPLTTTGTTEPIAVTEPKPIDPTVEEMAYARGHTAYQSDSGDESNVAELKPYTNKPSWEKPHDMPWHEWEAKGGTVPGWMKQSG